MKKKITEVKNKTTKAFGLQQELETRFPHIYQKKNTSIRKEI